MFGILIGQMKEGTNFNINETKSQYDLSLMWKVKSILDDEFVNTKTEEKITQQAHIWGAIKGMVNSYQDPYTTFLPPEENDDLLDDIKGEFTGIGAEIMNIGGYLTVISPLPGTPSFKAGLRPKDIIIEIDEKDALNMSATKAVKLIHGEKGTMVTLKIIRKGLFEPKEIEIIRDLIKIPTIKTHYKNGVFVIKLFSFTEDSPKHFTNALQKFIDKKTDKLIIDLRGNPGGHLFTAIYMAGMFLEQGAVILTEDYDGKKENTILKSGEFHNSKETVNIFNDKLKVAILVDGGSASASEILAGALSDHKKAIIMGTTTFGKGTVQQLIPLEKNTSLKVTVAKWILPNGKWISHEGLAPDIEIEITEEEMIKAQKDGFLSDTIDPQLNRAINELAKIKNKEAFTTIIEKAEKDRAEKEEKEKEEKIQELLKK